MEAQPVQIIPYLSFFGNCEEAIRTYLSAFGGEILHLSRWTEETCANPELAGKVMHTEFLLGSTRMSGGDAAEGSGSNAHVKLMVHMDSAEAAKHAIGLLSRGGEILSPLKPHPKPDDSSCGSLTRDRFGCIWIITCPNEAKR